MALLRGTLDLWPDAARQMGVAHVEHGLRGEQGHRDAEWVQRAAESQAVPFIGLQVDVKALQAERQGTIEETARRARYEQLSATALERNYAFVVTAHQRDDQIETILYNILRGTGLRGLQGMPAVRPLHDGPSLVRPMLDIQRSAVTAWLSERNIEWRTDESNESPKFTRNRLRNDLLPHLRQHYNPQLDSVLTRMSQQISEAVQCMDELAEQALGSAVLEQQPSCCRLDCSKLCEWPVAIIRHAFTLLWIRQSWPRKRMTFDHWQLLASVVMTGSPASASLPSGIVMQRGGAVLRLFLQDPATNASVNSQSD